MKTAALALLVASIWGINPIFEKLSLVKASPFTVITIRFILSTICLVFFAFIGGSKLGEIRNIDGMTFFWILIAAVLGALGLYIYFVALQQDLTSKIVPIIATFPLFTAFYAFILLKESMSTERIIGIVFVVVGVILINWNYTFGNLGD